MGQRAEVYIETGKKRGVITVPLKAIVWDKGKAGVFVVNNSRAAFRVVTLGLRGIEKAEVVTGLSQGDLCIVNPTANRIKEGQRVAEPMNLAIRDIRYNLIRFA